MGRFSYELSLSSSTWHNKARFSLESQYPLDFATPQTSIIHPCILTRAFIVLCANNGQAVHLRQSAKPIWTQYAANGKVPTNWFD
jgi:hypothetical protein